MGKMPMLRQATTGSLCSSSLRLCAFALASFSLVLSPAQAGYPPETESLREMRLRRVLIGGAMSRGKTLPGDARGKNRVAHGANRSFREPFFARLLCVYVYRAADDGCNVTAEFLDGSCLQVGAV